MAADLHTQGMQIKDAQGRTLMLRGVSLGGSSKMPMSINSTDALFETRKVSFIGRPFPLDQADAHFARLHAWGLDFVRLVVTWEAIEHAGPGQYDRAYLQYLHDLIAKAQAHHIRVLIDSHQDAWSRWTGGDGAPGWTLEAVGMDLRKLQPTGAATGVAQATEADRAMGWTGNYLRYGTATMFTLFFGGNQFAPDLRVDDTPVQDYLQDHYMAAMKQVALAIKDLSNVVGFSTLNEPGRGYIGISDLNKIPAALPVFGVSPTPLQGMLAAAGHPQTVEQRNSPGMPASKAELNSGGARLWREGMQPIWQRQKVWNDAGGDIRVLKPHYFSEHDGRQVNFVADHLMPFIKRYVASIRSVMPDTLIFIEPTAIPGEEALQPTLNEHELDRVVYAPKWYDGPTLGTQTFYPWLDDAGREKQKLHFGEEVAQTLAQGSRRFKNRPLVIGEFGLPMQLNGKRAYTSGDYQLHTSVMDSYLQAMETNLASALLWNYTADNTHALGDQWNGEDLSIYSPDDSTSGNSRALAAVVRPYPASTAGTPLRLRFDLAKKSFEYTYQADHAVKTPTELFVPTLQYPGGYQVKVVGGRADKDAQNQWLRVWADDGAAQVSVRIEP